MTTGDKIHLFEQQLFNPRKIRRHLSIFCLLTGSQVTLCNTSLSDAQHWPSA